MKEELVTFKPFRRWQRSLSTVVLAVFSVFAFRLDVLAETSLLEQVRARQNSIGQPVGKLQQQIKDLRGVLSQLIDKNGENVSAELEQLVLDCGIIAILGQAARWEFDAVEEQLKDRGYSQKAIGRHRAYVTKIESRLDDLTEALSALNGLTENPAALIQKAEEALALLGNWKKTKHKELEPEKLPRRKSKRSAGTVTTPPMLLTGAEGGGALLEDGSLTDGPPTPEDLAETPECQFTPEITALAAALGNNPASIYEHVRNNTKYEPYRGSVKGAARTLLEGAGNDVDLASLLIAVCRSAGIPARYVLGAVRVPIEQAKAWVGVDDPNLITSVFTKNNIPAEVVLSGGEISAVKIEHCWVTIYADYVPYRGATNEAPEIWLDIDPSFKTNTYVPSKNVAAEVGIDPATFMARVKEQAIINEAESWVTHIPEDLIVDQIFDWGGSIESYARANDLTVETLYRTETVDNHEFGILPLSFPYDVELREGDFSRIPENLRYQLKIALLNEDGSTSFEHTSLLAELPGKRITVSYKPATEEDEAVLQDNIDAPEFPVYLVNLVPELKMDGQTVASGAEIGMGYTQRLSVDYLAPLRAPENVTDVVTAGSYYAVGLNLQKVPRELLVRSRQKLIEAKAALEAGDPTVTRDDTIGEALNALTLNYFYQMDRLNEISAGSLGVWVTREPSQVVASYELSITPLLEMPHTARADLVKIDVDRDVYVPVSITGSTAAENQFMITSALTLAALEHNALEQCVGGNAVSSERIIQAANRLNIPIYTMDETNVEAVIPHLTDMPAEIITDIRNAAYAGLIVTIPQKPVEYGLWTGVGYVVLDPDTGDSAYMLEGGIAGGQVPVTKLTPAELLFMGAPVGYVSLITPSCDWLKIVESAYIDVAWSYIPAATSVNEWFADLSSLDKATTIASIIAVSGPITTISTQPSILNVEVSPYYISPNADAVQDATTISFEVTRDAHWTVSIIDAANITVNEFTGTEAIASVAWDGTDSLGAVVPDGKYTFEITAQDPVSGLEAFPKSGQIEADATLPTALIIKPGAGEELTGEWQMVTGTADDANFTSWSVTLTNTDTADETALFEGTKAVLYNSFGVLDTTKFTNGPYDFALSASDKAGNKSTATVSVTLFNPVPDTEQPTVTLTSPMQSQSYTGDMLFSATAQDNVGVYEVRFLVDGSVIRTDVAAPYSFWFDSSKFANGTHTATAEAFDEAGNKGTSTEASFTTANSICAFTVEPDFITPDGDGVDEEALISATFKQTEDWTLEIKNSATTTIRTFQGTAETVSQIWDGRNDIGEMVVNGEYTVNLTIPTAQASRPITVMVINMPPVATITSPEYDAEITAPTEIIGTAWDLNFEKYELWLSGPSGSWKLGDTVYTPVQDGVLGKLDPTLLQNDFYTLSLYVWDVKGLQNSDAKQYSLLGELKVGNFRVTMQDILVPVQGMPITITRTYDSLDKHRLGDFGYGWRMDISDVEIKESPYKHVFVTLPDGRRTAFAFIPTAPSMWQPWYLYPDYTAAMEGVHWELSTPDYNDLVVLDGEYLNFDMTAPYDPDNYTLKAPDGTVYEMSQQQGLRQIKEPNGNTLTYTDAGILHSTGKGITFTREGGLITAITDPMGNSITYTYVDGELRSVTDREENTTEFFYYADHNLKDIKDPRDITPVINEYDPDTGRLVKIRDANGNWVGFEHNVDARQEVVYDKETPPNPTVFYYDERGNVTLQVDSLGDKTTYQYDGDNNLIAETDPLDNTTTMGYDFKGNMTSRTDPLGNTTSYTYNSRGQVLTTTDPLHRMSTNEYNSAGNLIRTMDPLGNEMLNTYDAQGRLIKTENDLGYISINEYNQYGYLILTETYESQAAKDGGDPATSRSTFIYDDNGNQVTSSVHRDIGTPDEVEVTTTKVYDSKDRLTKVIDALEGFTETVYNSIDKRMATRDKNGNWTHYKYYVMGDLKKVIYPDNIDDPDGDPRDPAFDEAYLANNPYEKYTYDANGNGILVRDRGGRYTRVIYDSVGREVKTIYAEGTSEEAFTQTVYDVAGRIVESMDERCNSKRYEYDAAGRQVAVIDTLGNRTGFEFDAAGNQIAMIHANGSRFEYEHDALNRRVKTVFPDGTFTTTLYDELRRKVAETDQTRLQTDFAYDCLGRLVTVVQPEVLDPETGEMTGPHTRYSYDEQGNMLTQEDAEEQVISFAYDLLGRQTSRTLPMGETEYMEYNSAGNLVLKTDFKAQKTRFTYDTSNRLVSKDYGDDEVVDVAVTYTATGRRETITDERGITTFTYDNRDRLLSKSDPITGTISYTYDTAGNRTSVTTPNKGIVSYTFDALNRLETVGDPDAGISQYGYDLVGNRASIQYPNGTDTAYTYNSLNRLTGVVTSGPGGVISSYSYELGPGGNRTVVVDHAGRRVEYGYDQTYKLVSEIAVGSPDLAADVDIAYTYDLVGNRLTKTVLSGPAEGDLEPGTTDYTYNENDQLLTETRTAAAGKVTEVIYGYDLNGATVSKTKKEDNIITEEVVYLYNFENRMTHVETTRDAATSTVDYLYDQDGIRVQSTSDGQATNYLIDSNSQTDFAQVLEELDSAGLATVKYTYGDDLIAQDRAWILSFYHHDGQMSVRMLTDAAAAIQNGYTYDAFGVVLLQSETVTNLYRYVGEQYDPNLGFYYLRARYYNQATGRFNRLDPALGIPSDPASLHKYLYCGSRPIDRCDPSGKFFLYMSLAVNMWLRMPLIESWARTIGVVEQIGGRLTPLQCPLELIILEGSTFSEIDVLIMFLIGQRIWMRARIVLTYTQLKTERRDAWLLFNVMDPQRFDSPQERQLWAEASTDVLRIYFAKRAIAIGRPPTAQTLSVADRSIIMIYSRARFNTMAHEIGHALGLRRSLGFRHHPDPLNIMYRVANPAKKYLTVEQIYQARTSQYLQ